MTNDALKQELPGKDRQLVKLLENLENLSIKLNVLYESNLKKINDKSEEGVSIEIPSELNELLNFNETIIHLITTKPTQQDIKKSLESFSAIQRNPLLDADFKDLLKKIEASMLVCAWVSPGYSEDECALPVENPEKSTDFEEIQLEPLEQPKPNANNNEDSEIEKEFVILNSDQDETGSEPPFNLPSNFDKVKYDVFHSVKNIYSMYSNVKNQFLFYLHTEKKPETKVSVDDNKNVEIESAEKGLRDWTNLTK